MQRSTQRNRAFYFNGELLELARLSTSDQTSCPICNEIFSSLSSKAHRVCCGVAICFPCENNRRLQMNYQQGDDDVAKLSRACPICKIGSDKHNDDQQWILNRLKKHASNENAWALVQLADLASDDGNFSLSLALNDRAAALGHPESYYNMGVLYENGSGVKRSWKRAVEWYKRAIRSEGGHENAEIAFHLLKKKIIRLQRKRPSP